MIILLLKGLHTRLLNNSHYSRANDAPDIPDSTGHLENPRDSRLSFIYQFGQLTQFKDNTYLLSNRNFTLISGRTK